MNVEFFTKTVLDEMITYIIFKSITTLLTRTFFTFKLKKDATTTSRLR